MTVQCLKRSAADLHERLSDLHSRFQATAAQVRRCTAPSWEAALGGGWVAGWRPLNVHCWPAAFRWPCLIKAHDCDPPPRHYPAALPADQPSRGVAQHVGRSGAHRSSPAAARTHAAARPALHVCSRLGAALPYMPCRLHLLRYTSDVQLSWLLIKQPVRVPSTELPVTFPTLLPCRALQVRIVASHQAKLRTAGPAGRTKGVAEALRHVERMAGHLESSLAGH